MMPEDVPDDLRQTARKAFNAAYLSGAPICALDAALAAVAPAIAAQEREQIARWHDEQAAAEDALAKLAKGADWEAWAYHRGTARGHRVSAVAIRARGEAGDA
jgi:hypothetical protein